MNTETEATNPETMLAEQSQEANDSLLCRQNWARYQYGISRGHREYGVTALRNVDYYFGGGKQWEDKVREEVEGSGRPAIEWNEIFPAVNTALGHQLHNRFDIDFLPAGDGASQDVATALNKLVKYVNATCNMQHKESQMFSDGMICQRGYLDIRMDWKTDLRGDVVTESPDPLDIIPDPDASSYEPEGWSDVIRLRSMTLDEISDLYGEEKRRAVELAGHDTFSGFDAEDGSTRHTFGNNDSIQGYGASWHEGKIERYRVIDRQYWKIDRTLCWITPQGDIEIDSRLTDDERAVLIERGAFKLVRPVRRVRWLVTTAMVVLHDDWSPYSQFTIVPFFGWFYRGRSIGMVDNLRSPQDVLNKSTSTAIHVISSMANSGWTLEEDSLTNMTTDELEDRGAETGLVLEHKKGTLPPKKIEPNQMPTGLAQFIDRASVGIKSISGMNDGLQGQDTSEASGRAVEAKGFLGMVQLGVPLDNLARSRKMVAQRLLECFQRFMSDERVIYIETMDEFGKPQSEGVEINKIDAATGRVLNDLTIGKYDVHVAQSPHAVTHGEMQFEQAAKMREMGVQIPPEVLVKASSLADKAEILEKMSTQSAAQPSPMDEAKVRLIDAQVKKTQAETVNKNVEAQFGAMQTGQTIAAIPQVAALGDVVLRSSGMIDQDGGPMVPQAPGFAPLNTLSPATEGAPPDANAASIAAVQRQNPLSIRDALRNSTAQHSTARNTNPLTPANPDVGVNAGMETARLD